MSAQTKPGGKREGAGRPAGSKSKAGQELRHAAKGYSLSALETLAGIMADETSPSASRVAAANAILDRAAGKATNYLDLTFDIGALDPAEALKAIAGAVSRGEVSPQEGQQLAGIVESRIKALEWVDLEQRLTQLEASR